MKETPRNRLGPLAGALAIGCALSLAGLCAADGAGDDFTMDWHTIDCGGGTTTGGDYDMFATIGQPEAGVVLSGGEFSMSGGFENVPIGAPCTGDINGNGAVDFADILAILGAWGNAGGPEDVDGSGTVDFGDILLVLGNWGSCP